MGAFIDFGDDHPAYSSDSSEHAPLLDEDTLQLELAPSSVDGFADEFETLDERNARIREDLAGERERDRPGGDDASVARSDREQRRLSESLRGVLADEVSLDRGARRTALGASFRTGGTVRRPGRPRAIVDREQLASDITEFAVAAGHSLEEFAAPAAAGRPSPAEQQRLESLAAAVVALRDSGYSAAAIATALDRPRARVYELERRGRPLSGETRTELSA